MHHNPYRSLALVSLLSFVAMYIVMYAMVDTWSHIYLNVNKAYMAALMVAPMILIKLVVMRQMYPDTNKNLAVTMTAVALLFLPFTFIRTQAGIADQQFLRSMIPHHSSAILMCQEAAIEDQEIRELCQEIIQTQREEIDQMSKLLEKED